MDKYSRVIDRMRKIARASTDRQLADTLGVTSFTISRWRNGKSAMNLAHLDKFIKIYGISSDWLLYGKGVRLPRDDKLPFAARAGPNSKRKQAIWEALSVSGEDLTADQAYAIQRLARNPDVAATIADRLRRLLDKQ